MLNGLGVEWKQATFYKTVISDLSDLANVYYDILVFFSPSSIMKIMSAKRCVVSNFPYDFKADRSIAS